jgi:signal transduction histidine kinase
MGRAISLRFHKQSSSPLEISGQQLIDSVVSMFQIRIVNVGIHIEKRKGAVRTVRCFEGEIRQVLSDLVSNAIDAMHPLGGGRLLLRSRNRQRLVNRKAGTLNHRRRHG